MKSICKLLALLLAALALCACVIAEETDPAAAYEAAKALYEAKNYEQAIPAFEALDGYKDSKKMLANSQWYWKEQRYDSAVALYKAESYEEAQILFEELGSFEESKKYAVKCADAIAAQQLAVYEQECYEKAVALRAEGKLTEARDMFVEAGDANDSTDQLYEILAVLAKDEVYHRALADLSRGQYQDAITRFETLGDYQDSAAKAAEAHEALLSQRYEEAAATEDPNRACAIYLALGDYRDSAELAEKRREETGILAMYKAAETLRKEDRYAEAAQAYALCEGYKESKSLIKEMLKEVENSAQFERAHILTDLWQLEEANAIYKALGRYSYASRMGIKRISAKQLRDDATTEMSEIFTAPDGTTHRYRIFKGVPRWVEAKAFCQALGGHLATMTSEEENQFVHQFMMDNGFLTAYFGLEDEERDQTWEWVTGEPVEYCPWDSGEPSYSPRERYGMYFYKHLTGTWNDAHFYEHAEVDPGCSFICEWDLTD